VYAFDEHGGDGGYLRTNSSFDYKNRQAWFNLIHWHMCSKDDPKFKPLIPTDGSRIQVKKGQLLGYADNSGAPYESNGDHLHWGGIPTDSNGFALEPANGFGGCIDIMPYWDGTFAVDVNQIPVPLPPPPVPLPPLPTPPSPLTPANASSWLASVAVWLHSIANWLEQKGRPTL
jgi:hypothetical protein